MWYVLQFIIIVGLCILFKSEIAPDRNMGHIFLFSVLVAYAITWLISRAIDQVRTNSRTCFMISLLITAAVIGWPVWQAPEGPLNGSAFVIIGVIGFCIFVPSMWVVSKSILLVRRLQGYPPPARPVKPPVTLAALVERWRGPLTWCIFFLLAPLFASLPFHAFDLWGDGIRTYLGQGWGGGLFVISLLIVVVILPAIATRAILQWLLRGGSGLSEGTPVQAANHPDACAALLPPEIRPKKQTRQLNQRLMVTFIGTVAVLATSALLVFFLYAKPTTPQHPPMASSHQRLATPGTGTVPRE
jgi:hypothetical protein